MLQAVPKVVVEDIIEMGWEIDGIGLKILLLTNPITSEVVPSIGTDSAPCS